MNTMNSHLMHKRSKMRRILTTVNNIHFKFIIDKNGILSMEMDLESVMFKFRTVTPFPFRI